LPKKELRRSNHYPPNQIRVLRKRKSQSALFARKYESSREFCVLSQILGSSDREGDSIFLVLFALTTVVVMRRLVTGAEVPRSSENGRNRLAINNLTLLEKFNFAAGLI